MSMDVFPITLDCDDMGWSSHKFQPLFLKSKPAGETWYGYDVVIHSPTDVEFVVYDMLDNVRGGLGKVKYRFAAKASPDLTADAIEHKILQCARLKRAEEIEREEERIIAGYADALRAALHERSQS